MMDLARHRLKNRVEEALQQNTGLILMGPRQCGKTSLALDLVESMAGTYFDLDNPSDARRLENPMHALASASGLIVVDHVQAGAVLLAELQILALRNVVDSKSPPCRFLILGNSSPLWDKNPSDGFWRMLSMGGFEAQEVGMHRWKKLWLRGQFPPAFLAETDSSSMHWRQDYLRSILERDLHLHGVQVAAKVLHRLLHMLAHQQGRVVNTSELGRSLGEAHTTVKRHLEILEEAQIIRQLQPWQADISKRQIKAPKLYIRDCGLAHALLGLNTQVELESHPGLAPSWESFCIEHIISWVGCEQVFFWGTHGHAELDLLVLHNGHRIGFDFTLADAPHVTRAMHIAHADLDLDKVFVVYPGVGERGSYKLNAWAEAVTFAESEGKVKEELSKPIFEAGLELQSETVGTGRKMGFAKFFGP